MHTFHIPVLGLGYSVDTPIKVAHLGISSVASIVDDEMIERMRKHHTLENGEIYTPIRSNETDFRSRRITAYLDLVARRVERNFQHLKQQPFTADTLITRYFELLPDTSTLKKKYNKMLLTESMEERVRIQEELRNQLVKGPIDVNIMSKVDKLNKDVHGVLLDDAFSDASAALRGFAKSSLQSSVVLSAGMNPRLYNYLESFTEFYPDQYGRFMKKVILKVSDFRSAFIQAKYLAKKGIWVSEFRIESGLNCGGHAFATDGYLLGPILEEFKTKRREMLADLFALYHPALNSKNICIHSVPDQIITVQGGIGTAEEHHFLMEHYEVDGTGWGSPFLLVPEVTNVDEETLRNLVDADQLDYYVSNSSPLGVLFNNFRKSSAEKQRLKRIAKGRPGSPCNKKYLVSNTEFTTEPICTASRQYQQLKIGQLQSLDLPDDEYRRQFHAITEKLCLCDGLSTATLIRNHEMKTRENRAVAICPGPNLAWFSAVYSLDQMVQHIYGKTNLLSGVDRPHMFINELNLYTEYYQKELETLAVQFSEKRQKYLARFREQLLAGIQYYMDLFPQMIGQLDAAKAALLQYEPA
ncbi:hypothetical protein [Dyadobacter sediminis]|uniref:Uncharacterized protein n=1 Tax=Dyadobacter sediminis TaxID=1493691 RepID=A0A5R9KJG8_9BACT|nr:hypothetical protein [Dyadobacter sediminis]TLU96371.1 hypothetical protein FEM55_04335 [Dyadobacter sediminis]GGB81674.1 hypothetical protein GCM10011325_06450 [Dyadobacter sediminis]